MDEVVFGRVVEIVSEHLDVERSRVTPDASLIDDLAADSLDVVALVRAFEREFDFDIPVADYQNLLTVRGAARYLDARLGWPRRHA